jgi:hypothetical protein
VSEVFALSNAFNGLEFKAGEEVAFTWTREGRLECRVSQVTLERRAQKRAAAPTAADTSAGTVAGAAAGVGALVPLPGAAVCDVARGSRVARALFEVYCGRPAQVVSRRAKDTFERNVQTLVARGADWRAADIVQEVVREHTSRTK